MGTEGKYEETTRYLRKKLGQLGHASRDLISMNAKRTMMRNAGRPTQQQRDPTEFERVLEEISEDTLAAMQTAASNDPEQRGNEDVSQLLKSRPTIIEIMSSTDSVQPPPSEGTSQNDPPTEQVLRNAMSMNNMAEAQFQSLQGTINKGSKRRKTSSLIDLSQTTMKDINMAHLIANMKLDAAGRKALFEALDANEKREHELAMASEETDENMDTGDGNYIFPKKSKRARKLSPKIKNTINYQNNQFEILRIEDSSDDEP